MGEMQEPHIPFLFCMLLSYWREGVYTRVCTCPHVCMWRSEVRVSYLPQLFFTYLLYETTSLIEPRAHQLSYTSWPARARGPFVFASLELGLQVCGAEYGLQSWPFTN